MLAVKMVILRWDFIDQVLLQQHKDINTVQINSEHKEVNIIYKLHKDLNYILADWSV